MCRETLEILRKATSRSFTVTIDVANTRIVGPAWNRIALLVSVADAGVVFDFAIGTPDADQRGFVLTGANLDKVGYLLQGDHWVTRPVYCTQTGGAGTEIVRVTEVLLHL